jgi:hypothetical protein
MRRFGYFVALAAVLLVGLGGSALATPHMNGVVVTTRIFNDCPVSNLTVTNDYPGEVTFAEDNLICFGWANLHNWTFSSDHGLTQAPLSNVNCFEFDATVNLSGNDINGAEAGMRLSPWWSQQVDGRLNIRIPDGEIAAFGGVLPFYSFTGADGIHYVAGQDIRLMMIYRPYANTAANPGTVEYKVLWGGTWYDSGELPFGNCTPGEEAHGCYGIMDDARAGGYAQNRLTNGDPSAAVTTSFFDLCWEVWTPPVPAQATTWGGVKATYR